MFKYEKYLEYPVNIRNKDLRMARLLLEQLGGANGELSAALRYFCQRYTMPCEKGRSLLTDIATEELAHIEIIQAMIKQLTAGASISELKKAGLDTIYAHHKDGIYPSDSNGIPYTASYIEVTGNPIVDLMEDMAAEEKARSTYENLMDLTDDTDVLAPLSFLRQREVVHFNRFKELYLEYKKKGL